MPKQSELEFLVARYTEKFQYEPPQFVNTLTKKEICSILRRSLRDSKSLSELSEVEFLQMQYRAKFDEPLTYNFITIHTEEQLITALRECLESGKAYELPEETRRLIDQGAVF